MNDIVINGRSIGPSHPPYIIAEVSGNHNGDIDKAKRLICIAKESGADAVKLQTYTADTMTIDCDNEYFKIKKGPWGGYKLYDLYKWAYTPWEWHQELFSYAKELGITILSTPFDETAVDFLEELNVPVYKIASFEATDHILIKKVISTGKPIIISTGMVNENELDELVNLFDKYEKKDVIFLHCVSGYPTPVEDSNISAINRIKNTSRRLVGLSDHTLDLTTSVMAVSMGACVIEKHFIESRNDKGPDSDFSLEPHELKELVRVSSLSWKALGTGSLELRKSEMESTVFRRSIFFVKNLNKGDIISEENIRRIRPGYGLAPKFYDALLGKKVLCNVTRGMPVTLDNVSLKDEG